MGEGVIGEVIVKRAAVDMRILMIMLFVSLIVID